MTHYYGKKHQIKCKTEPLASVTAYGLTFLHTLYTDHVLTTVPQSVTVLFNG